MDSKELNIVKNKMIRINIADPLETTERYEVMLTGDPSYTSAVQRWKGTIVILKARTRIGEYYILLISSLVGVNYMISAGNFLMFYLGLELTTIPIAALAAYDRYKSQSAEAGIKLILSSAFSSAILLFGLSMIYGTGGSMDFANLTAFSSGNLLHVLGFIFFFAGLAFKITIVPFHLWTADVYEGSPVSITSYLSVVSKGSAKKNIKPSTCRRFPEENAVRFAKSIDPIVP